MGNFTASCVLEESPEYHTSFSQTLFSLFEMEKVQLIVIGILKIC